MKPRPLTCCCCGSAHIGRQWWNQDTGYGLCGKCHDWIVSRGTTSLEEMAKNYGDRGYHYDIPEEELPCTNLSI